MPMKEKASYDSSRIKGGDSAQKKKKKKKVKELGGIKGPKFLGGDLVGLVLGRGIR